jgi:hypothetical protein
MARPMRSYAIVAGLGLALAACGDSSTGPTANPPTIVLATSAVTFAAPQGAPTAGTQTVAITNSGSGQVGGLTAGPITYAGASGWLSASLDKTVTPATLTLSTSTSGLSSGSYTADVAINAVVATNSPQHVGVTLLVLAGSGATTFAAAGQSAVFLAAPNQGVELTLQAGSQYLIAVVNTDTSHTVTEDFTLVGGVLASASARSAPLAAVRQPASRSGSPVQAGGATYPIAGTLPSLARMQQMTANHLAVLGWSRQIYARMGNPRAVRERLGAPGARVARLSAAITTGIGSVSKVYVKKQLTGDCTNVDSIGARTVEVGQHVIVLADTNQTTWPQAQRPDSSFYKTFADEYDQVTWPHIQTNVGDPLAYDANLSGLGKVTVTLTPVLNGIGGGVVAFVNPCDFFPFAASGPDADFSNDTEMFYSLVPSANGFHVTDWEKELRSTASHETKHLVSFTDRILNNSPVLEEIWLEEGLAQESSEIWMRHFNQATWKGKANFLQTVACEIDLGANAPCDAQNDKPLGLAIGHLPFLFTYLQQESQSNSEGLGADTPSNYGAGWAFARWATDQYATDEGTFIKALVNEPALNGLPNLSSHTGQSIPLLLMYWNLASAIYNTPTYTAADPRITIPSFDLANIFQVGQTKLTCSGTPCGLFTPSGKPVYPIQPIALTSGSISHAVHGVPGTAAAFFLLSASADGTEALQLASGSGGSISASSGFRLGIIRVN